MSDKVNEDGTGKYNLQQVFDAICETEAERKKLGEDVASWIDYACVQWQMSKAGFKAALKWYNMSEGERKDFEATMQQCREALATCRQMDIFDEKFDQAMNESVEVLPKRPRRKSEAPRTMM